MQLHVHNVDKITLTNIRFPATVDGFKEFYTLHVIAFDAEGKQQIDMTLFSAKPLEIPEVSSRNVNDDTDADETSDE